MSERVDRSLIVFKLILMTQIKKNTPKTTKGWNKLIESLKINQKWTKKKKPNISSLKACGSPVAAADMRLFCTGRALHSRLVHQVAWVRSAHSAWVLSPFLWIVPSCALQYCETWTNKTKHLIKPDQTEKENGPAADQPLTFTCGNHVMFTNCSAICLLSCKLKPHCETFVVTNSVEISVSDKSPDMCFFLNIKSVWYISTVGKSGEANIGTQHKDVYYLQMLWKRSFAARPDFHFSSSPWRRSLKPLAFDIQ